MIYGSLFKKLSIKTLFKGKRINEEYAFLGFTTSKEV